MVADLSYTTTSSVIESWEALRRIPNYREEAGVLVFEELFKLEPEGKTLFGFNEKTKFEDLRTDSRFVNHASLFVRMFDKAVEMIGPDTDMLTDILLDLGEKHAAYGVKPEYFPTMGRAIIGAMKKLLVAENGEDFTETVESAWYEMFGAMSYDMIRGQRRAKDHGVRRLSNQCSSAPRSTVI